MMPYDPTETERYREEFPSLVQRDLIRGFLGWLGVTFSPSLAE
jgi:hypothetical protein